MREEKRERERGRREQRTRRGSERKKENGDKSHLRRCCSEKLHQVDSLALQLLKSPEGTQVKSPYWYAVLYPT